MYIVRGSGPSTGLVWLVRVGSRIFEHMMGWVALAQEIWTHVQ